MKEYESYNIGVCENCGKTTKVRPVEAFSAIKLGQENQSRGFYQICFDCFKPRVKWMSRKGIRYTPTDKIRGKDGNLIIVDVEELEVK